MNEFDDNLPDDLLDIAERLREERAAFTPYELDSLRGRLATRMGRPQRRGRLTTMRAKSLAGLAAIGLMLTSGTGVVIAASALGGGRDTFHSTLEHSDDAAAACQYHGHHTEIHIIDLPHGKVIVIITFDCRHFVIHIGFPGHHFNYGFNDQATTGGFGDVNGFSPPNAKSLTVNADGHVLKFPLNI